MSRSDSSFDFALEYLIRLQLETDKLFDGVTPLIMDSQLLKTFVLYARTQAKSNNFFDDNEEDGRNNNPDITPIIEDVVSRVLTDINSVYITSGFDGPLIEIKRCREDTKFLGTIVNELYISQLDNNYSSLGHYQPLVELLHFFSSRLDLIHLSKGVDGMELIVFLTHIEVAVGNGVQMIYIIWFDRDGCNAEERNKMQFAETFQFLQKNKPVGADPQIRQTYIQLLTASKLSRASTHIFSRRGKEGVGLMAAIKFIHSLLHDLTELLQSYASVALSVDYQMLKLHQGLRFLSILLGQKHKEFTALDDELKDLIGVVVIDAGILICSLSSDELKEGMASEIDVALSHWLRVVEFIMSEVVQIHPPISSSSSSSSFSFPKSNELGSFDFLLQHLKELASIETDSIAFLKDQFHTIREDLVFLRSFLENIAAQRYQNRKLQTLWSSIMEVAYKAEFVIDSIIFLVYDKPGCSPMSLDTITKEINSLKIEVLEIYDSIRNANTPDHRVTKTSTLMPLPSQVSGNAPKFNEVLAGLHKELNTIIDVLTRGFEGLDIVIVGMPGLGKTTCTTSISIFKHGVLFLKYIANMTYCIRLWVVLFPNWLKSSASI